MSLKRRLPPELLILIVKYADEYSTYEDPSESILALHATSSIFRSFTAPYMARMPFLSCPLEEYDPGSTPTVDRALCPNLQYTDSVVLEDLFDTTVSFHIDMEMSPDCQSFPLPGSTCPSCAAVASHFVRYLAKSSPFPSLTCIAVSLPSNAFLLRDTNRPKDIKEIFARLFGLPRLHVFLLDTWSSGPLPLPSIPNDVAVELHSLVDFEDDRLKNYFALSECVTVLYSPNITLAMLERWAPSLHRISTQARRSSLENIVSIPEFKTYENGLYLDASHIDALETSGCSSLTVDFGLQSLELYFLLGSMATRWIFLFKLFEFIPVIMPRIRYLSILKHDLPSMPGHGDAEGSKADGLLSLIRGLPSLRSVQLDLNIVFPLLVINLSKWIQETAFEYAQMLASASNSLHRIELRSNDIVAAFVVERDVDGEVVSVSQKREVTPKVD